MGCSEVYSRCSPMYHKIFFFLTPAVVAHGFGEFTEVFLLIIEVCRNNDFDVDKLVPHRRRDVDAFAAQAKTVPVLGAFGMLYLTLPSSVAPRPRRRVRLTMEWAFRIRRRCLLV